MTTPDSSPPLPPSSSLPKRSPSRVRFNFKDSFTPLEHQGAHQPHVAFQEPGSDGRSRTPHAAGQDVAVGLVSDPGTPTLSLTEAAAHIRRTLSLGSLTNLLDLATEAARQTTTSRTRTTSLDPALALAKTLDDPQVGGQATAPTPSSPTDPAAAFPPPSSQPISRSASAPPAPIPSSEDEATTSQLRAGDEEEEARRATLEAKRELARQTLRDVREAILRPSDEPPRRPADWERVFVLTMLKSTRSFISAYGLRAGVQVLLFIFKTLRTRRLSSRGLVRSFISSTALRFALLLSTFTFLHTLVSQSLRLAPPFVYVRRRIAHSLNLLRQSYSQSATILEAVEDGLDVLSLDCSFGPPPIDYDYNLGERRWHAAAAGAVAGGCSIYWIRHGGERRAVIEQVLVRGLEGAWRGSMRSAGLKIPHGEIVLFGLCAGQIMYSWINEPERMPKTFNNFITSSFNGPPQAPKIYRSILRNSTISTDDVRKVLDNPRGVTLQNRLQIGSILRTLDATGGVWPGPRMIPKALLQPTHDGYLSNLVTRFGLVFKGAFPVYATLHFLPAFLLKRGSLIERNETSLLVSSPESIGSSVAPTLGVDFKPQQQTEKKPSTGSTFWTRIRWKEVLKILKRSAVGTLRSGSFLAMFVFIYHGAISAQHVVYPHSRGFLRRLLVSKQYTWFAGFLTCLALFFEAPSRRPELALYVLPRSITAAYMGLRHRTKMPRSVPLEEGLLTAWAMAMLCDRMRWGDEKDLSKLARKVLYQFT